MNKGAFSRLSSPVKGLHPLQEDLKHPHQGRRILPLKETPMTKDPLPRLDDPLDYNDKGLLPELEGNRSNVYCVPYTYMNAYAVMCSLP